MEKRAKCTMVLYDRKVVHCLARAGLMPSIHLNPSYTPFHILIPLYLNLVKFSPKKSVVPPPLGSPIVLGASAVEGILRAPLRKLVLHNAPSEIARLLTCKSKHLR